MSTLFPQLSSWCLTWTTVVASRLIYLCIYMLIALYLSFELKSFIERNNEMIEPDKDRGWPVKGHCVPSSIVILNYHLSLWTNFPISDSNCHFLFFRFYLKKKKHREKANLSLPWSDFLGEKHLQYLYFQKRRLFKVFFFLEINTSDVQHGTHKKNIIL